MPAPMYSTGVKVLIVEDDFIVAYDMQTLLEEQGAHGARAGREPR